jgi:hypothetical protein
MGERGEAVNPTKNPTLGEVIATLLCPIFRRVHVLRREIVGEPIETEGDFCKCGDPWPINMGCVYGYCGVIRCRNCHKIIDFSPAECHFPYSVR